MQTAGQKNLRCRVALIETVSRRTSRELHVQPPPQQRGRRLQTLPSQGWASEALPRLGSPSDALGACRAASTGRGHGVHAKHVTRSPTMDKLN